MMNFKVPLPVFRKQLAIVSASGQDNLDLPTFRRAEFSNISCIGKGSFGKVYKATRDRQHFVIKEQVLYESTADEKNLFIKEAKLLKTVSGHENIVRIHGFSVIENSILLEFVSFDYKKIGIEHSEISTLKEFLITSDAISDYDGFDHLQHFIAHDVINGLSFLHNKGIAHRNLKPDNILVSNTHYSAEDDVPHWWAVKPIVSKLTDFGESRSSFVQTSSFLHTKTTNINRGTLPYMAPEIVLSSNGAEPCARPAISLRDMKAIDIWALGMIFFHLTNPN